MPIGTALKALRKRKDWSQGQLALYSGVSRSYISLIEQGKRPNPSATKVLALARAFGMSVDDLLGLAGYLVGARPVGQLSPDVASIAYEIQCLAHPVRQDVLDLIQSAVRIANNENAQAN